MSEGYVSKRSFSVSFGETIAMAEYQSIRPSYSETIEITKQLIPDGLSVEKIRTNFIEEVRKRYLVVREQAINDFYVNNKR